MELASRWLPVVVSLGIAAAMATTVWMSLQWAPREASMGDAQRIVYFHVAFAWSGLAASVAMGAAAVLYLARRRIGWDHWSQTAGEIAWLCWTLTLASGSLWAHEAWNTWWTWEPRLTAAFLMWALLSGYFLVRASLDGAERKARISAVLAIVSIADVPMIILATRWFRGMHPVAPEMDSRMRLTLLVSVTSFTVLFGLLGVLRRRQLRQKSQIESFERAAGALL
jgi:heme exporter protein C